MAVQRLLAFARRWQVAISGPSAYRRVGKPICATEKPLREMRIHGRRLRLREIDQDVIEQMKQLQMPGALALDITILSPSKRRTSGIKA